MAYHAFKNHDDYDMRKRAFFYNAAIAFNRGDYPGAMHDVLFSHEIAKENSDNYWIAKSSELIADIYYEVYNYGQAATYTRMAADYYKKADKILNHRYALCNLANTWLNENKEDEAFSLLDSLRKTIPLKTDADRNLMDYIMSAYRSIKDAPYQKNDSVFANCSYVSPADSVYSLNDMIEIGKALYDNGNKRESESLLKSALNASKDDKEKVRVKYAIYQILVSEKDYEKASLMADTLLTMQSEITRDILNESASCVQRDFYNTIADVNKQKARWMEWLASAVTVIALLSIIIGLLLYRFRMKSRKAELEANMASLIAAKAQVSDLKDNTRRYGMENKELHEQLKNQDNLINSLQHNLEDNRNLASDRDLMIKTLFKEKWDILNMLCREYFELGDSDKTRIVILKDIEKELARLMDKKNIKEIETAVDRYLDGIMTKLREECSFLKEEDFIYLSLVFAGLSPRAVCMFTGIKYKLYYLKKSRFRKRISDSDAPHKGIFLEYLT